MKGGPGQADPGKNFLGDFPQGHIFCNRLNSFHISEGESPCQVDIIYRQ
jgi:hypothetical protein